MATLTLTIGALTSSRTVTNTRAANVLTAVFDLYHPPEDPPVTYTNQEKLDWIVQVLIPQTLTQMSRQQTERLAVEAMATEFAAGDGRFE